MSLEYCDYHHISYFGNKGCAECEKYWREADRISRTWHTPQNEVKEEKDNE